MKKTDEKIDEISKQWAVLKHEYRNTRDAKIKDEIKEKWDKLQKRMETLEKKRREIMVKKNEIDYKTRWKLSK